MDNSKSEQHRKPIASLVSIIAFVILAMFSTRLLDHMRQQPPRRVTYNEFLAAIDRGELSQVEITYRELIGHLKKPASRPNASRHRAYLRSMRRN